MAEAAPLLAREGEALQMVALGLIVLAAHLGGKLCRRLRISEVTGQLLGGALVGPYALHLSGILGPDEQLYDNAIGALHFFVFVFLSLIAFAIGEELHIDRLRRVGRAAVAICLTEAATTLALVTGAFLLLSDLDWTGSLLVGCVAIASSPAVTFVLMNQLRIEGRLRQMAGSLVVLTDLLQIVLFSILVQIVLQRQLPAGGGVAGNVALEIGEAALLGGAIFLVMRALVRRDARSLEEDADAHALGAEERGFIHRMLAEHPSPSAEVLLVVIGSVSIGAGAAYALGLPFLVTAIVAGFLVANLHSQAIFDSLKIENITSILNLGFFALVGASLHFSGEAEASLRMAGLYLVARFCGKYFGTRLGCRLAGEDRKITACLPSLMLPQVGVAAVEALFIGAVLGDARIGAFVLTGIVIFEVAGVYMVDRQLRRWRSWVADEEKALRAASGEPRSARAEAVAQLRKALPEQAVAVDLAASGKAGTLQAMVDLALASGRERFDREQALQLLGERERLAPTGLGHGVAIPHCRLMGLDRPLLVFVRLREGVVFGGVDENPCRLILMILSPARDPGQHLKLLAASAHLFSDEAIRQQLLGAPGAPAILRLLSELSEEQER